MNKAVSNDVTHNCSHMLSHLLDQQHDCGAAMLSLIERYTNHFARRYNNLDFYERQDIRQEVAIKLFCHGEKVRDNCSRAWVYAVVRNQCINHVRKRSKQLAVVTSSDDPELDVNTTGSLPRLNADLDTDLLAELDCLHKVFDIIEAQKTGKTDISLYTQYAFGFSYNEIADKSKRSVNAIGTRISVLKKRLKKLVVECC